VTGIKKYFFNICGNNKHTTTVKHAHSRLSMEFVGLDQDSRRTVTLFDISDCLLCGPLKTAALCIALRSYVVCLSVCLFCLSGASDFLELEIVKQ